MGLIGWILLGELALVALVGAVVAFLVSKIRENRMIVALGGIVQGLRANEFERREEMQFLCSELFRLTAADSRPLIDSLLDAEKRHMSTLARILLERDMDALGHFHEQIAELTDLHMRATGEALRQARSSGDQPPDDILSPATESFEAEGDLAHDNQTDGEATDVADPLAPVTDESLAEASRQTVTPDPAQDPGDDRPFPSLLTPEEIEREIWGELEQIESESKPEKLSVDSEFQASAAAPTEADVPATFDPNLEEPATEQVTADESRSSAAMEAVLSEPAIEQESRIDETLDEVAEPSSLAPDANQADVDEDLADRNNPPVQALSDETPTAEASEQAEPTTGALDDSPEILIPPDPTRAEESIPAANKRKRRNRKRSAPGSEEKTQAEAADDTGDEG